MGQLGWLKGMAEASSDEYMRRPVSMVRRMAAKTRMRMRMPGCRVLVDTCKGQWPKAPMVTFWRTQGRFLAPGGLSRFLAPSQHQDVGWRLEDGTKIAVI